MIKKARRKDGSAQVTFVLPDDGEPVSVVADRNAWDPHARRPLPELISWQNAT